MYAIIRGMMENTEGRSTIEKIDGALQITIPAKRHPVVLIFIMAWFGGWVFGEFTALNMLIDFFNKKTAGVSMFVVFWLIAWTVAGFFVLKYILWMICGREIIKVSTKSIILSKKTLCFKSEKEYAVSNVKNIRVVQNAEYVNVNYRRSSSDMLEKICFDYGMKTVKFGIGLDEAEANYIVEKITQKINPFN